LTYDITRNETFTNLTEWLKEVRQNGNEDVRIYLIGNKSELEDEREVTFERAMEFARQN
jgi:Ras-related protein Rab-14